MQTTQVQPPSASQDSQAPSIVILVALDRRHIRSMERTNHGGPSVSVQQTIMPKKRERKKKNSYHRGKLGVGVGGGSDGGEGYAEKGRIPGAS